jgi:Domain of Unknown Function with PDB structure (DUF3857)
MRFLLVSMLTLSVVTANLLSSQISLAQEASPKTTKAVKPIRTDAATKPIATTTNLLPRKIDSGGYSYSIAPPGAWVQAATPVAAFTLKPKHWHYASTQHQVYVDGANSQTYVDVVRQINDVAGLQEVLQIDIAFSPIYQRLTFHAVEIQRGAQTINLLQKQDTVTLLRREQRLEEAQITGQVSASLQSF